jgi:hypothetical protein
VNRFALSGHCRQKSEGWCQSTRPWLSVHGYTRTVVRAEAETCTATHGVCCQRVVHMVLALSSSVASSAGAFGGVEPARERVSPVPLPALNCSPMTGGGAGAHIAATNDDGETALHLALARRHVAVASVMGCDCRRKRGVFRNAADVSSLVHGAVAVAKLDIARTPQHYGGLPWNGATLRTQCAG